MKNIPIMKSTQRNAKVKKVKVIAHAVIHKAKKKVKVFIPVPLKEIEIAEIVIVNGGFAAADV